MKLPPHCEAREAGEQLRRAAQSIDSININYRSKAKDGTGWYMGGPENAFIEAGRQRDRQHRGAAIEGALTNAREAGRQLD